MLTVLEKVEILQKVPLFKEVPTESLARIAAIAQEVSLEPRKVLYKENAAADTMFVVLEGEVSLVANGQERKKVGPHRVAGALPLLAGMPQPESAVAVLPTVALEIDQQEFHDVMADDFNVTRGILRAVIRQIGAESQG
jgi:CRP-like cAMP-binding protein